MRAEVKLSTRLPFSLFASLALKTIKKHYLCKDLLKNIPALEDVVFIPIGDDQHWTLMIILVALKIVVFWTRQFLITFQIIHVLSFLKKT
jgi:hypothetical protein